MHDLVLVERSQSSRNLDEDVPNLLFFHVPFKLVEATNLLVNVSVVSILHDQAERRRWFVDKCFFETDYVGVLQ